MNTELLDGIADRNRATGYLYAIGDVANAILEIVLRGNAVNSRTMLDALEQLSELERADDGGYIVKAR